MSGHSIYRRAIVLGLTIAVGAFAGFQDVAIGLTGPLLGGVAAAFAPASVFLVGTAAAVVGALVASKLE